MEEDKEERLRKLTEKYFLPTHETDFFKKFGFERFVVLEGVLPPEKSVMGEFFPRFLFENKGIYRNKEVLELGTGAGILGLVMAKHGAKKVVATDILEICAKNAVANAEINSLENIFEARTRDLFGCVKKSEKFDVIVFNHPLLTGKRSEGNPISVAVLNEGNLLESFLAEAPKFLKPGGKIIQGFAELAEKSNDPKEHAAKYGLKVKILATLAGPKGKILFYELKPKNPKA